jgi:hypothetical protein
MLVALTKITSSYLNVGLKKSEMSVPKSRTEGISSHASSELSQDFQYLKMEINQKY